MYVLLIYCDAVSCAFCVHKGEIMAFFPQVRTRRPHDTAAFGCACHSPPPGVRSLPPSGVHKPLSGVLFASTAAFGRARRPRKRLATTTSLGGNYGQISENMKLQAQKCKEYVDIKA